MADKKKPKKSPKVAKKPPGIRSCPFCGGAATRRKSKDREHWVACLKCGALGPFTASQTLATEAWNQREVMTTTG